MIIKEDLQQLFKVMGPESNNLPSRPRFSWDIRTVPWTDGRGNQEQYAEGVSLWQAFQDTLADSNSNKEAKAARGIMLQSQLFGRARDLCKAIQRKSYVQKRVQMQL